MRFKLAIPALALAYLLGATAIVSAQTNPAQPAPGASNETTPAEPGTGKMKSEKMKSSKMKSSTTTGMGKTSGTKASKHPQE